MSGKKEDGVFHQFRIRNDGTIVYEILNRVGDGREYWIAKPDGNGGWNEKKIWETNEWEFAYILDFNQYGLIIVGESCGFDTVAIKDNGEAENINNDLVGQYLFTDNGYFCSNAAELENKPWSGNEWFLRYLADTVSFYDYEGNVLRTYPMINKELLEQGYYLRSLTYSEGRLTGFYAQWDTKELYISQVEADIHD